MNDEWKKQIRREASLHRMCEDNRKALEKVYSKAEAISLYKKTIDWALEEGYPHLSTLRKYFSDCESEGIFIDRHFSGEILDFEPIYVFHNCSGIIRVGLNVEKKNIPMLYFANGCNMLVVSSGPSSSPIAPRVPLYIFGENTISTEETEDIEFKIYKFSVK